MAPIPEDDDWSDSDEEALSDVETSVTLGVPDGPLKSEGDVIDAAVSRIGGLPAFLVTPEPSLSSSHCKICAKPMELLVQMWCPLEDSPMDRALYVWGCAASTCQKKDGSIRAWRGLRFNTEYAAKLEEKLAKKKAKAQEKKTPLANPFSMGGSPVTPNPFSLGTQVFGSVPQPVVGDSRDEEHENESDAESDTSEHSLITALTSTKLEDSPWNSTPHYPPQYLSTVPEYIAPERKRKVPSGADVLDATDDVKNDKSAPWNSETYENSLDIDQVFERFSKRVEYEPEQCVRYELNGTPLPFARGVVYDSLFPPPPPENLPVTKPDFKVVHPVKRVYSASCIPSCPSCRSHRVFECQLMPNLINILRDTSVEANKKLSDEERRKIVEQELKGGAQVRGMEWGTAIVFSCEKDCVEDGAREAWREEHVLIQWDE